ncbi:MAG: DUF2490 domain-containing protein [Bacteroidota bacterium]
MKKLVFLLFAGLLSAGHLSAQGGVDEDQLGAWYMYFGSTRFKNSQFGVQGDYQFRFWEPTGDLEQILLRTGLTYTPKSGDIKLTLGYGNITSGVPGESTETSSESRVYQEALFSQKIGTRLLLTHRLRYEQRWVEGQDFRTRYRYNLFVNIPLNATKLEKNTVYIALYNEIFINGERQIGDGRSVQYFDRNRTYTGLGYGLRDNLRCQAGWMKQTTANWAKGQLQFSLHHSF